MKLLAALLLLPSLAWSAPFLLSEKMPAGPEQPEAFYALVGETRLACNALKVASTGTVQMSCDLEALQAGSYPLVVVTVKPSNSLETLKSYGTLEISKKYGARNYGGLRLLNTSYQVKP